MQRAARAVRRGSSSGSDVSAAAAATPASARSQAADVAPLAHGPQPLDLRLLAGLRDGEQLDVRVGRVGIAIHAHDDRRALLDRALLRERLVLDPALDPAALDRRDGTAALVDLRDDPPRLALDGVGQSLDVLRTAERVGDVCDARLVQQHLLRAQRDRRRALGGQGERLVVAVRVQRLAPAGGRGEGLQRDAHDVVERALGRERRAAGLGVEAQGERALVARPEALAHERGPDPAGRAEFRDLGEDVVVGVEEEREARREDVDLEAGRDGRLDVGDAVREREPELLRGTRAGLADVVPGDRDRVEARQALVAVAEEVDRQAHRRARREDVVAARGVLLEHVVLHRASQLLRRDAVRLARQLVEQQQDGRGRVDRHRRRHLAQRDAVEQPQHVVERVDRDARAAHLAAREGIVRVEAELRGQVERDREARLPALEQQVEALVRLLGRREPRVLAHRPRARGVAVGADAACVRVLAGALLHVLIVVRGEGLPVRPRGG